MNNGNFKDIRLIEAFDYIDPKYIAEVGESLKLRSVAEPQSATYTKPSPFKYWKQYVALVACVLLLSLATPLFGYVAEMIGSFAAGSVSGTTEAELSDTTENEITSDTDIHTTTELHESVLTPNYLKFVSDLEPISEEKMLEIRKAWLEKQREFWYDYYYLSYSYYPDKYTEDEARTKATQDADKAAQEVEYVWFVLSVYNDKGKVPYKFRYYGMIGDYAVLVEYRNTTFNYSDEILYKKIGSHTFYFKAGGEIYLYKDGVFETMKEVYEQGLITDDDIGKIERRHTVYEHFYENWRKEEYYKYFAELTE